MLPKQSQPAQCMIAHMGWHMSTILYQQAWSLPGLSLGKGFAGEGPSGSPNQQSQHTTDNPYIKPKEGNLAHLIPGSL